MRKRNGGVTRAKLGGGSCWRGNSVRDLKLPFKAHAVKVDSCRSQCRITDVFDAKIKVASTFESSNFLQLTKINN